MKQTIKWPTVGLPVTAWKFFGSAEVREARRRTDSRDRRTEGSRDGIRRLPLRAKGANRGLPTICRSDKRPRRVHAQGGADAQRPARRRTGGHTRCGMLTLVWQLCVSLRSAGLPGSRFRRGFEAGINSGREYQPAGHFRQCRKSCRDAHDFRPGARGGEARAWRKKLNQKVRCNLAQVNQPEEERCGGQETAATRGGLQVSDCAERPQGDSLVIEYS